MQDSQSQAADTKKGNGPNGDQATAQARRKSRDGKIRQATEMAEKLYCDIKDVRDELSILKSAVQQQEIVQKGVYRKKVKDGNLSSTYVLNDLKELETVAERIESAVSFTLTLTNNRMVSKTLTLEVGLGQHNPFTATKRDCKFPSRGSYVPKRNGIRTIRESSYPSNGGDKTRQNPHGIYFCYRSLCKLLPISHTVIALLIESNS